MCILIGQHECFYNVMKHENKVSNMVGSLQVLRIYIFMKEIKLYTYVLHITMVFLLILKMIF